MSACMHTYISTSTGLLIIRPRRVARGYFGPDGNAHAPNKEIWRGIRDINLLNTLDKILELPDFEGDVVCSLPK